MDLKEKTLEKLSNKDYQVTSERVYFIDLCREAEGHFTASDLLELDRERENSLSRATIYNSLEVFLKIDFLRHLPEFSNADYYEIRKTFHPHAHCRECDRIIDVPVDLQEEVEDWDLPFQLEEVNMNIAGLCQRCYSEHTN